MENKILLNKDHDLIYSSFKFQRCGMIVIGNPTFEEWEETGKILGIAEKSVLFWIGDWLNYGEHKWGEMYAQALDKTDFDYQTLKDAKWVANRVELSLRKDNLTFNHHKEVASLNTEKQKEFLDLAKKIRKGL